MFDRSEIMLNAWVLYRNATAIAAGKKVMDLVTGDFNHPNVPSFSEFLRESWRRSREGKL